MTLWLTMLLMMFLWTVWSTYTLHPVPVVPSHLTSVLYLQSFSRNHNCYSYAMNKYKDFNPKYKVPGLLGGLGRLLPRPFTQTELLAAVRKDLRMLSVKGAYARPCSWLSECLEAVDHCTGRRVYGYIDQSHQRDFHFIVDHNRTYWDHKWGRNPVRPLLSRNLPPLPMSDFWTSNLVGGSPDVYYVLSMVVCLP